MAKITPEENARAVQLAAQDPQLRELAQQMVALRGDRRQQFVLGSMYKRLRELGVDVDTYRPRFDQATQTLTGLEDRSWWDKHGDQVIFSAVGGLGAAAAAPYIAAAASGSGAGAGAAATATGTGTGAATGGGTAAAVLPEILSTGSEILSNMADTRAQNRIADANYQQEQDRLNLIRSQIDQSRVGSEIDQQKFLADEYTRSVREAARGGLMLGVDDVVITPPDGIKMGQVSGGLKPSALSNRYDLGRQLMDQAVNRMKNPTKLMAIPEVPAATPPEQQTGADKALNYTAAGTAIASAALPALTRRKVTQYNPGGYSA